MLFWMGYCNRKLKATSIQRSIWTPLLYFFSALWMPVWSDSENVTRAVLRWQHCFHQKILDWFWTNSLLQNVLMFFFCFLGRGLFRCKELSMSNRIDSVWCVNAKFILKHFACNWLFNWAQWQKLTASLKCPVCFHSRWLSLPLLIQTIVGKVSFSLLLISRFTSCV